MKFVPTCRIFLLTTFAYVALNALEVDSFTDRNIPLKDSTEYINDTYVIGIFLDKNQLVTFFHLQNFYFLQLNSKRLLG